MPRSRCVACDWLAFGHHQDDQAETLLFPRCAAAACAGGGDARGGAGGRVAAAPLLGLRRMQLLDWAGAYTASPGEDEQRRVAFHLGNAIRHRLLPVWDLPGCGCRPGARCRAFRRADELLGELAAIDAAASRRACAARARTSLAA